MAQQLMVRSSFAVAVVVVQCCCRPVVRGKKKGPYRCHIKLNNHESIFLSLLLLQWRLRRIRPFFLSLYYFAFCFVALPLLLKDLHDLN